MKQWTSWFGMFSKVVGNFAEEAVGEVVGDVAEEAVDEVVWDVAEEAVDEVFADVSDCEFDTNVGTVLPGLNMKIHRTKAVNLHRNKAMNLPYEC